MLFNTINITSTTFTVHTRKLPHIRIALNFYNLTSSSWKYITDGSTLAIAGHLLLSVSQISVFPPVMLSHVTRRVHVPDKAHHPQMGSLDVVHEAQVVKVLHWSTECLKSYVCVCVYKYAIFC